MNAVVSVVPSTRSVFFFVNPRSERIAGRNYGETNHSSIFQQLRRRKKVFAGLRNSGTLFDRWITLPALVRRTSKARPYSGRLICRASAADEKPVAGPVSEVIPEVAEALPKKTARLHDFCLGIPYGAFLIAGGLLTFFRGPRQVALQTSALGALLLAASVRSLTEWKREQKTLVYIGSQAVLSLAIAVLEANRYAQGARAFPTIIMLALSSAMFAFFLYVILAGGPPRKKAKKLSSLSTP
eukprot:TRINITY_DN35817_c0_g1_i1.p1 TRINITY_DN35817_c0_g1~~TRINITY_DN35817_c0_g1_i1.p1  ORF type:complete len:241 (-),score=25.70 TRINITY_DN35817_c0_g1_i1:798-1520(-)